MRDDDFSDRLHRSANFSADTNRISSSRTPKTRFSQNVHGEHVG